MFCITEARPHGDEVIIVRPASIADLPHITEIHNYYVRNTHIIFDVQPFSPEQRVPRFNDHTNSGRHRILVAEDRNGKIVGYTATGSFRSKEAYETTDVSLLWLKSSSDTDAAVKILEDNGSATGVGLGQIFYGPSLSINFNDPTRDPRTPDIIVVPNVGVTYSGSHAKQEEHGGFAHDDTNVMLLLSLPGFSPRTVHAEVGTAQVAPTILEALGLNPEALLAVRVEGTGVLPEVDLK